MAKFKVGDRVRISPSSCHYVSGDNRNPKDLSGSINCGDVHPLAALAGGVFFFLLSV